MLRPSVCDSNPNSLQGKPSPISVQWLFSMTLLLGVMANSLLLQLTSRKLSQGLPEPEKEDAARITEEVTATESGAVGAGSN